MGQIDSIREELSFLLLPPLFFLLNARQRVRNTVRSVARGNSAGRAPTGTEREKSQVMGV